MQRRFTKPAKTFQEQVQLLQSRGMLIDNEQDAIFYLQHLNYYRLTAYWLPFESDHATHQFKPNTKFSDVLKVYIFDRELRLLLLDCIERIEVSVRSQWAYQLAHQHSPHAHLDWTLFDTDHWQKNLNQLANEVSRSKEKFIEHFNDTYDEPFPPIWAVSEVMSLGLLSRWYDSLKPIQTRRGISSVYGLNEDILESWLRHLSSVRNLCAHHSRLWNRDFSKTPKLIRSRNHRLVNQFVQGSRKIYNTLVIVLYFMDVISPDHHLRARLQEKLNQHPEMLSSMGFSANWQQKEIWQC
jgi:abortive infection bacteriophage resistance protein